MKKTIRHRNPTKKSLREMPEVDFEKARVRKNPYAERIALGGISVQVGKGRPRKLQELGGTVPRSIRFPQKTWELLEQRARKKGMSLHAALRQAIAAWSKRAA